MFSWNEFYVFGVMVLGYVVVPFLLCWISLLVFTKLGGPKLSKWKLSVLTLIGWLGFCIVGLIGINIFSEVYYKQIQYLLLLFLAVYVTVVICPLKYISRFSFFKNRCAGLGFLGSSISNSRTNSHLFIKTIIEGVT